MAPGCDFSDPVLISFGGRVELGIYHKYFNHEPFWGILNDANITKVDYWAKLPKGPGSVDSDNSHTISSEIMERTWFMKPPESDAQP